MFALIWCSLVVLHYWMEQALTFSGTRDTKRKLFDCGDLLCCAYWSMTSTLSTCLIDVQRRGKVVEICIAMQTGGRYTSVYWHMYKTLNLMSFCIHMHTYDFRASQRTFHWEGCRHCQGFLLSAEKPCCWWSPYLLSPAFLCRIVKGLNFVWVFSRPKQPEGKGKEKEGGQSECALQNSDKSILDWVIY